MELFMYNVDEYQPLEQSNSFAPIWPFRMAISGSSDSGKTTMMINLLIGTKNVKEDGERYISCNDVVLIGKHLDELKWKLIENFYNTLAEQGEDVSFKALSVNEIPDIFEFDPARFTIVIFEDLVNASKKIQEQIADYITNGQHRNISSVYISQRFFAIIKIIRENINYISLHRGDGSLLDIKRIISQYTEHSNSLASVIDDLTLKKEFIVFDLRRSRDDSLSIRVRWDTSLKSIIDHPRSNLDHPRSNLDHPRSNLDQPRSNLDQTEINILSSIKNRSSKFSSYGQKAILEAKKNGLLIDFARNIPIPKERKILLADEITVKNSDTWTKYVFREAFGIKSKDLGPEWIKFADQTKRKRESLNFYVIRNF
ncbi:hypothetical protein Glove_328g42 [Diversispora epigaea]|uniref:Uncharacterized protein n=1 Tax=Diversispora epigaea TaxID=1348612 RepID=A0A397HL55_9GLOM|nr:hypothetical protein Glove_328g42 [Diversispora epigaea]